MDVSCICLTHGRPWLVAEAAESFRRQRLDGLTAELLIVNDCPEQSITCAVPGVRIIQGMEPFRTLSEKWNYAVYAAPGTWIACWDDDDISLSHRLTHSVKLIGDCDAYRATRVWACGFNKINGVSEPLMCAGMMRRDAYMEVGGSHVDEWNDKSIWGKLWPRRNNVQDECKGADIHYIYRWGGIGFHDSGLIEDDATRRAVNFRAAILADKRFKRGAVDIVPAWQRDYEADVRDAIDKGKGEIRA